LVGKKVRSSAEGENGAMGIGGGGSENVPIAGIWEISKRWGGRRQNEAQQKEFTKEGGKEFTKVFRRAGK